MGTSPQVQPSSVQLPPGFEDAKPVDASPSTLPQTPSIQLPKGYEDATPVKQAQQPGVGERVWKAGKEELGNLASGIVAPVKAAVSPPEDATEHAIASIGGPGGLIAYRTSRGVVDAVENMAKAKKESFQQAKVDMIHAINEFHKKDYRNALADTGSFISDFGGVTGEPLATMGREREIAQGAKAGGDLATPVTKDMVDLGAAAALERIGGKLTKGTEAAAEGTEAAVTPKQPGLVKQIIKGEKVAQGPADQALRTGAKAAGGKAANPSLRTVLEEPIDTIEGQAKAAYRQVDEAAGTDFKALREKLENTEYQLRQLTETEEDIAKEGQLEKSRTAILDKIDAAKQQAIKAGVDPKLLEQADAQFKQAGALKDLQAKVFKNPGIISGNRAVGAEESINVNQAAKELQKLQDNTKYGSPRLEQAFGKEGAQAVLRDMYAAQKQGITALSKQQFVARIAKIAGVGGVGYEVLRGLFGGSR